VSGFSIETKSRVVARKPRDVALNLDRYRVCIFTGYSVLFLCSLLYCGEDKHLVLYCHIGTVTSIKIVPESKFVFFDVDI